VKKEDFTLVERPEPDDPERAGLNLPRIFHPTEDWKLRLLDNKNLPNLYEGCVKFTDDKGQTKWHPGGVLPVPLGAGERLAKVLPRAFKSLSWVGTDDDKHKKTIETYTY
jgi:hypothetical protein